MKKSFADEVSDARVMLAGIMGHQNVLAERKLDEDFMEKLREITESCVECNNEQERLKSCLKMQTKNLNDFLATQREIMREAKKIVKLCIPKAGWVEFGIKDKQ